MITISGCCWMLCQKIVLHLQADSRRSVEGFCKLVHSWESRSGGDAEALSGRQEDPERQGENFIAVYPIVAGQARKMMKENEERTVKEGQERRRREEVRAVF